MHLKTLQIYNLLIHLFLTTDFFFNIIADFRLQESENVGSIIANIAKQSHSFPTRDQYMANIIYILYSTYPCMNHFYQTFLL